MLIVTAPLVVARQVDGSSVYLYAGAPVPESIPEVEMGRLVEGGFVEEFIPLEVAVEAVEAASAKAKSSK